VPSARTGLREETGKGEGGIEGTNAGLAMAGNTKEGFAAANMPTREAMMRRSAPDSLSSSSPLTTLSCLLGTEKDARHSPPPGSCGKFGVGLLR